MSLNKVVVALDYENPETAFSLVDTLGPRIETYKIGPVLFTRSGTETIRFLHNRKKRIFVDLKLHDTPQVVAHTVSQLAEMGIEFTTLHCLGGKKMLAAASTACRGSKMKLLGVTLLTSFDPNEAAAWGWTTPPLQKIGALSELVAETRLAGILCSPNEIVEARKYLWDGALVVTPGIRQSSRPVYQDDQVRIATPQEALSNGADYLIVGRPITQSADPVSATEKLFSAT